jgi:hypothetical protein
MSGFAGFDRAQAAYDPMLPREPTAAEEAAAELAAEIEDEYGEPVEPDCELCGNQAVCPECVGT